MSFGPEARIEYLTRVLVRHNVPAAIIDEIFGQAPDAQVPVADQVAADRQNLDRVVVCVACGGICRPSHDRSPLAVDGVNPRHQWDFPSLIKANPGFLEWCKQPWTATAYHRCDNNQIRYYHPLHFIGGPGGFTVVGLGTVTIDTKDAEMYLPIHRSCLQLAQIFCQYQSRFTINFRDIYGASDGEPSSIAHLYEIWMKRAWMALPELGPLQCPIPEPTNYSIEIFTKSLVKYAKILRETTDGVPVQETDPIGTPFHTNNMILNGLSGLGRLEPPSQSAATLIADLHRLPVDVYRKILDAMEPLHLDGSQMECTRILPPSWWKKRLFNGSLIPWLFDLHLDRTDAILRHVFGPHVDVDNDFDWELLCRKLATPDVFGEYGIFAGAKYLMNRRRIWTLLANARLGHTIGGEHLRYSN
ncbi:hypothetical protein F4818DRAFT_452091 [Hypoxylon cercidicola]|nr:hypothetical protein F4818DRAFT_452091 [Hypoxylon cercidicola]